MNFHSSEKVTCKHTVHSRGVGALAYMAAYLPLKLVKLGKVIETKVCLQVLFMHLQYLPNFCSVGKFEIFFLKHGFKCLLPGYPP
jgi:hypothetical protein